MACFRIVIIILALYCLIESLGVWFRITLAVLFSLMWASPTHSHPARSHLLLRILLPGESPLLLSFLNSGLVSESLPSKRLPIRND